MERELVCLAESKVKIQAVKEIMARSNIHSQTPAQHVQIVAVAKLRQETTKLAPTANGNAK
jgi:hypothetical protein